MLEMQPLCGVCICGIVPNLTRFYADLVGCDGMIFDVNPGLRVVDRPNIHRLCKGKRISSAYGCVQELLQGLLAMKRRSISVAIFPIVQRQGEVMDAGWGVRLGRRPGIAGRGFRIRRPRTSRRGL